MTPIYPITSRHEWSSCNTCLQTRLGRLALDLWLIHFSNCRTRNRANGATQTFRRPSLATNVSNTRESNYGGQGNATPTSGVYVPPHLNASLQANSLRNGAPGEARYTKDQLLALYKQQREAGALDQNLSAIFTGGWDPIEARDSTSSAWGRRDEGKESNIGPEICWDHNAKTEPLALVQMSDEEREVRSDHFNFPVRQVLTLI
jgi:PERQ amino acid-rich with GYF domain-containing protein